VTLDRRNLRALVLVTWSAFLTWLWATGETVRYLGPRTEWLVPFGALALGAAAAVYLRARGAGEERLRPGVRELAGCLVLVLPVVMGLLLANTQLGAMAASKKLTARGIDPSQLSELASSDSSQVSFLQVKVAEHNPKFADDNAIHPGRGVRLLGFVASRPAAGKGRFELARFYLTCCVADSVPIGVTIEPGSLSAARYRRDDWLAVSGELVRQGRSLRVRATRIQHVRAPKEPYLSFSS
jgi:putative membrane protein